MSRTHLKAPGLLSTKRSDEYNLLVLVTKRIRRYGAKRNWHSVPPERFVAGAEV